MAIEFELIFTNRVTVTPKVTLGDGTDVTDYADAMVMEVRGTSGDGALPRYSAIRGDYVSFATPAEKTAEDFVAWSTLSASQPAFLQPLMDSYSGTVSAQVVSQIESQFNAPINENVPAWSGTE